MKYKIGDKVKIKTWKEMEKEFGIHENGYIKCIGSFLFTKYKEKQFKKQFPNRIVEIAIIDDSDFKVKEINNWYWPIMSIKEKVVYEPINSRFEILDIR